MFKKLTAILLSATLLATLVGCGGSESTYEKGAWNGDVYRSDWIGLSFRLSDQSYSYDGDTQPSLWLYTGALYDEKSEPKVNDLEEVASVEFGAKDYKTTSQIVIYTEELVDEDMSADEFMREYEDLLNMYKINQCTFTSTNAGTRQICGTTYQKGTGTYDISMMGSYTFDMYVTIKEDRIVYIFHQYKDVDKEKAADMMNCFF